MAGLHDRLLIIDGLIFNSDGGCDDLLKGNYAACNLTLRSPVDDFEQTFDAFASWIHRTSDPASKWHLVLKASDIDAAKAAGKVGLIMGWQDTKMLGDKVQRLAAFHRLGLRIVQLTYNEACPVGDGCLEPRDAGLSRFGFQVVEEMNRLGMAIDLSHCGERTATEAARHSKKPVLLTHANAKSVTFRVRNKTDETMRAVADGGGLVGASIHGFMNWDGDPERPPTLALFIRHLKHIVNLVGIDHVSFGTDFASLDDHVAADRILEMSYKLYPGATADYVNAFGNTLAKRYPDEINNPSLMRRKTDALLAAGFSESDVEKIMGRNLHRVLGDIWGS
jgi:membrane dipeptidase